MVDLDLAQAEGDALIAMEKHRANEDAYNFPGGGQKLTLPLQSPDKREQFLLDLSRGGINLAKVKMQNRARKVVVLVRLCLGNASHPNPDGKEIPSPHLHVYREGYGDKCAVPVPADRFRNIADIWATFEDFMRYCNITQPPHVKRGLFT